MLNLYLVMEVEGNGPDARNPEKIFETSEVAIIVDWDWGSRHRSIAISRGETLAAERRHPTGLRFNHNPPVRPSKNYSFGMV